MREALLAYLGQAREEALDQYRWACVMYALQAPHTKEKMPKPELPPILRSIISG